MRSKTAEKIFSETSEETKEKVKQKTNEIMKQTAVEWLQYELASRGSNSTTQHSELFEQAKEMEKQNMINFLKSAFSINGFDYETFYDKFISGMAPYQQELPKTQIDWSGFPKSTQEQVGFTEPNMIDKWLDKNGSSDVAKQVEQEVKEIFNDLLSNLINLNKRAISENWKMKDVGEEFFKIFAYSENNTKFKQNEK